MFSKLDTSQIMQRLTTISCSAAFILMATQFVRSQDDGTAIATPSTIQLLVQGSIDQVRVTSAWTRSFAFQDVERHGEPTGWIRIFDANGDELAKLHFDLSTVNRDRGATKGQQIVRGDTLLEASVTRLVKIPDFGGRMASLSFESIEDGKSVPLGRTTRSELDRVLNSSQVVGPLGALTVRTHINNGPVQNRYDIVCIGDAYRASDEALFVSDVNKWTANLFAKEPYKTYAKFFNVHSVFRASVDNLADKPTPCTNPPVVRNTVYNASYCVGGTDRCLYINNTTLASQDAAQAPDVEGRIAVFVNDPKYGGCASTFAVSYNGSSGPEVQSHEFGHSFGGLADEYDYGRSGTYTGGEPGQANITANRACTKWSLWINTNGVGCFEGAGYYLTGLFRPKSNCLMRSLGIGLCEICREELVLDGYTTVNPIEAPQPSATSVTVTKPATQVFSFTNLVPVPSNPRVRWYVDNLLQQSGSSPSFTLVTSALTAGTHTVRCEVFDQTAMVRKDNANKRNRTRTWTVTVREGGLYTSYGSGCVGSGSAKPVTLDHVGVPQLGTSFQVTLANAPAAALAAIWVGFTKTNVPLPANLAPTCTLYTTLDVFPLAGRVTDGNGFASVSYPVPNDASLRGVKFYNEWFVFDKAANTLGLTFTNGGEATVGG